MASKARIALMLGALSLTLVGCDVEQALQELAQAKPFRGETASIPAPSALERDPEHITVASFNIQVFGTSKLKQQDVMDVLAKVVRRFDVVAIQEIRAKDQELVPQFLELINSDGSQYDYVVGPRLGRTSSKEQYAFLFDAKRIEVDRRSVYTVDDDAYDLLHREPLVARFRVRGVSPESAFTFTLINIHTDPDETDTELDALDDVYRLVQDNRWREDDVILLGDLNVDEQHLGELGQVPGLHHVVAGVPTNTRGDQTYDNIVFHGERTLEHTGRWGVLDLCGDYGLSMDQALDVSDHLPIWAEFSVREGSARLAEVPAGSSTR